MIIAGIALLTVGFILIMPRDSNPGSLANRQVRQGALQVVTTPGHSSSAGRTVALRIAVGVVTIAVGILFLFLA